MHRCTIFIKLYKLIIKNLIIFISILNKNHTFKLHLLLLHLRKQIG